MIEDKMQPGERWVFVPRDPEPESNMGGIQIIGAGCAGPEVCWFGDDTQYYPCEGTPPTEERGKLMAAAPALRDAVSHLIVCAICAEDGLASCIEGEQILALMESLK